jgi:POT family proton-dependent oligopeptide transporter
MWDNYDNKANYFLLNFILLLAAAIACFMMLRWLNKIMVEKGVK